jgi:hypothetical protein
VAVVVAELVRMTTLTLVLEQMAPTLYSAPLPLLAAVVVVVKKLTVLVMVVQVAVVVVTPAVQLVQGLLDKGTLVQLRALKEQAGVAVELGLEQQHQQVAQG